MLIDRQSTIINRTAAVRLCAAVAGAALVVSTAACGGSPGSNTGNGNTTAEHYKVGVVLQMTGSGSVYADAAGAGFKAGVVDVNARNVAGRTIDIEIADSGPDAQSATTTCTRLVQQEQVKALAVFIPGPLLIACNAVAKAKGIPMISESSGAGTFCQSNLVSIGLVPNQQSTPPIGYLLNQGKKSWYFFGSDYSTPKKAFAITKPFVTSHGGTVAGESYEPLGTSDFSQDISKIVAAHPDAVFINTIGNDDVAFQKQWAADPRTKGITRVAPLMSEGETKALGGAAEGVWSSNAYFSSITGASNDDFKAKIKATGYNGLPDVTSYLSYMPIELLAGAIKQGGTDSAAVISALQKGSVDGPVGTFAVRNAFSYQPVYLAQGNADGTFSIKQKTDATDPQLSCDS
jgi:branched-chain amino acid transport system substrate-binding protein